MHKQPKLLEQTRLTLRVRQYSLNTERTYLYWIKQYILFHQKRHPKLMGKLEVEEFLSHLAINNKVAPSTQNQALQAILFLYRIVLDINLPWLFDVVRAKRRRHLPEVLSIKEVKLLLAELDGTHKLIASLFYGSGLRLLECLRYE